MNEANFKENDELESLKDELSSEYELTSAGFTERLNYLARKHSTITSLAESAGISISGVQRLLKGGNPTLPVILKLAKHNNVSVEWLATGKGSQEDAPVDFKTEVYNTQGNPIDINEFVFIPRYNVYASAGHGCDASQENYMHSMAFRKYWIDNVLGLCAKDLIVIGVKGDSMEGEISDGDVILINTADKYLNNGIYVIRIDGDLIVKRIQKLPGNKIEVSSTNNVYRPFEIDLNNQPTDFGAIGRVVWHGRNVP